MGSCGSRSLETCQGPEVAPVSPSQQKLIVVKTCVCAAAAWPWQSTADATERRGLWRYESSFGKPPSSQTCRYRASSHSESLPMPPHEMTTARWRSSRNPSAPSRGSHQPKPADRRTQQAQDAYIHRPAVGGWAGRRPPGRQGASKSTSDGLGFGASGLGCRPRMLSRGAMSKPGFDGSASPTRCRRGRWRAS